MHPDAVSTSHRHGTSWAPSAYPQRDPTQVGLMHTSLNLLCRVGGLLFQQVDVQAIGHLPWQLHRACRCSPELW